MKSSRRIAYALATAALLVAVLELASGLTYRLALGSWPTPRAVAEQRAQVAAEPRIAAEGRDPIAVDDLIGQQVVHPYLGFVFDPILNEDPGRRARGDLRVGSLGFFDGPDPLPTSEDPDDVVTVGVFGGSAAFLMAFQARDTLVEVLQDAPSLAGRRIVVRSYALGGWKQPQHLLALTYLLARGEAPDLVLVLDGFNEVMVPWVQHRRAGRDPDYPMSWWRHARSLLDDPRLLALAGERHLLQAKRRELAAATPPILAASPTWNLVWATRDRRLGARLAHLEDELDAITASDRRFLTHGPETPPLGPDDYFAEVARRWEASTLAMHRLCRAYGIPSVHALQPNQYLEGTKPMSAAERRLAIDEESRYRTPVVEGYPHLLAAGARLAELGVPFLDLTRAFSDLPDPLYVDDCCHVSAEGSRLLVRALAERVVAELPVSDRRPD